MDKTIKLLFLVFYHVEDLFHPVNYYFLAENEPKIRLGNGILTRENCNVKFFGYNSDIVKSLVFFAKLSGIIPKNILSTRLFVENFPMLSTKIFLPCQFYLNLAKYLYIGYFLAYLSLKRLF